MPFFIIEQFKNKFRLMLETMIFVLSKTLTVETQLNSSFKHQKLIQLFRKIFRYCEAIVTCDTITQQSSFIFLSAQTADMIGKKKLKIDQTHQKSKIMNIKRIRKIWFLYKHVTFYTQPTYIM